MPRVMLKRAALVMLLALGQPVHAADFTEAASAFEAGDFETALDLWQQLAELGNTAAQNNLGFMYEKGLGVRPNPFTAADWYRRSADQGNPDAQVNLGVLYATGFGVPQDLVEAHKLFHRAAEAGNLKAKQDLSKIVRLMSPEQFALARLDERDTPAPPPAPPAKQEAAALAPAENTDGWRVQLASLTAQREAEAEWARLRRQHRILADQRSQIMEAKLPKGTFYRVQIVGLADRGAATAICETLQRQSQDCFVVPPA